MKGVEDGFIDEIHMQNDCICGQDELAAGDLWQPVSNRSWEEITAEAAIRQWVGARINRKGSSGHTAREEIQDAVEADEDEYRLLQKMYKW